MVSFIVAATISLITAVSPSSLDSDFEIALGNAGLSTKTARFDTNLGRFFASAEYRTPFYESAYEIPWRLPYYADMHRRQFEVSIEQPSEILASGTRMLGAGTRRTLTGNPIQPAIDFANKPGALKAVLERMERENLLTTTVPDLSKIPPQVQRAAALVLRVALDSVAYRRLAFSRVVDLAAALQRAKSEDPDSGDADKIERDLDLYRSVDLRYLFVAAHDVTLAAKTAQGYLGPVNQQEAYSATVGTTWGKITLSGAGDQTVKDEPILLCIDTGGNDTYINAPANKTQTNWVSVVIDSVGNDHYLSAPELAKTTIAKYDKRKDRFGTGPASALFGISVLLDTTGDDLYRSHKPGIASAFMGAATLCDSGGTDTYDGYQNAEGAATFGYALLEDASGDDHYFGFNQIQGFAGSMGFAMLMDRAGSDSYMANDEVIDFPSAQSATHNLTMGQGAASGRRADYLDGHSLSGGIGILFDVAGDDTYFCSVFGQGAGYWEGVGMLWDSAGADKYMGQWYVQGAAAHFAIGYLEDLKGNDETTAMMNMAIGAGHDFSIGMYVDDDGVDQYHGPNLSLGAGNANGIGVFVDAYGNDRYDSSGLSLGKAAESPKGTLREKAICLGLFIDLQGDDTYPARQSWARNGERLANWTDKRPVSAESQVGIFYDR